MAIPAKLSSYLKANKLAHDIIEHKTVFTAYDTAQTLKVKLNGIAKTLLLKVKEPKAVSDDPKIVKATKYVLAVVPAHVRLDFGKVKKLLAAKGISIASENEMAKTLKVKPGALTAFGAHHKLTVVMDKTLGKVTHALFGAGSFTESLRVKVSNYQKLEKPITGDIAAKAQAKAKAKPKPKK